MDEERQFIGSYVSQERITLHNGQSAQLTVIEYTSHHDIYYNQYYVVIRNQNLCRFLLKCLGFSMEGNVLNVSVVLRQTCEN